MFTLQLEFKRKPRPKPFSSDCNAPISNAVNILLSPIAHLRKPFAYAQIVPTSKPFNSYAILCSATVACVGEVMFDALMFRGTIFGNLGGVLNFGMLNNSVGALLNYDACALSNQNVPTTQTLKMPELTESQIRRLWAEQILRRASNWANARREAQVARRRRFK